MSPSRDQSLLEYSQLQVNQTSVDQDDSRLSEYTRLTPQISPFKPKDNRSTRTFQGMKNQTHQAANLH